MGHSSLAFLSQVGRWEFKLLVLDISLCNWWLFADFAWKKLADLQIKIHFWNLESGFLFSNEPLWNQISDP